MNYPDGYEYGIWFNGNETSDLHRWGFTEEEATEWLREWEEEVAPNARPNIFAICRRKVGNWEVNVDGEFHEFERE